MLQDEVGEALLSALLAATSRLWERVFDGATIAFVVGYGHHGLRIDTAELHHLGLHLLLHGFDSTDQRLGRHLLSAPRSRLGYRRGG